MVSRFSVSAMASRRLDEARLEAFSVTGQTIHRRTRAGALPQTFVQGNCRSSAETDGRRNQSVCESRNDPKQSIDSSLMNAFGIVLGLRYDKMDREARDTAIRMKASGRFQICGH